MREWGYTLGAVVLITALYTLSLHALGAALQTSVGEQWVYGSGVTVGLIAGRIGRLADQRRLRP